MYKLITMSLVFGVLSSGISKPKEGTPQECIEKLLPANHHMNYAQYDRNTQFIYMWSNFENKIHPPRKSTRMRLTSETDEISRRYMKTFNDFHAGIQRTQLKAFDMNSNGKIDKDEANDEYYYSMMILTAPKMIQLIAQIKIERTKLKEK